MKAIFSVLTPFVSIMFFCLISHVAVPTLTVDGVAGAFKPLTDKDDSFEKSLSLKGSRSETLNFAVRIQGLKKCAPIRVRADGAGAKVAGLEFRFYQMEMIKLKKKSFAGARSGEHYDPLIPLDEKGVCPAFSSAPAQTTRWVWGEVSIREKALPGDRKFWLEIGDQGSMPLQLRVWKMVMPIEPSLKLYSEFAPYAGVLGHYGKWHESEGELAARYYQVMLEHGVVPLNGWIKVPEIRTKETRRLMDLDLLPNPRDSFQNVLLRQMPSWAMVQLPGRMDLVEKTRRLEHFQAIENTIAERKLAGRAFVYLADEPKESEIKEVAEAAKLVRKSAPSLKILVVTDFRASLKDLVNIFVVPMNHVQAQPVPKGVESWWYVSCMSHGCDDDRDSGYPDFVIERESSSIRSIGWLTEKAGISNFLYYQMNYAYKDFPSKDPWTDQWAFTGNGEGNLFYPGRPGERGLQRHEPVTSIRLKTWREAAFDHQYLKWVHQDKNLKTTSAGAPLANEIEVLRRGLNQFETSRAKYQAVRDRIGDFLNESPTGAK